MIKIYDSGYRGDCPKEEVEQIDSVSWFRWHYPKLCNLFFHPVNEGKIPIQYRAKLKKAGMLKGVSDLVLLYPSSGHHYGLFELKRRDRTKSRTSPEQKAVLQAAVDSGGFACICYGFEDFKKAMADYLA